MITQKLLQRLDGFHVLAIRPKLDSPFKSRFDFCGAFRRLRDKLRDQHTERQNNGSSKSADPESLAGEEKHDPPPSYVAASLIF